jgi:hypothetical protein
VLRGHVGRDAGEESDVLLGIVDAGAQATHDCEAPPMIAFVGNAPEAVAAAMLRVAAPGYVRCQQIDTPDFVSRCSARSAGEVCFLCIWIELLQIIQIYPSLV